ncbi:MAG: cation-translocating P-type ATPase [Mycoplasmataceae bacterium]|nr:cation-translocating P-type ATPase [Mycoplasmataceae bacterium]
MKQKKHDNENDDIDNKKYLNTDKKNGLTDSEVLESRNKFGENVLEKVKNKSFFTLFFQQLIELMPILLLTAGLLSLGLSIYKTISEPEQPGIIITYVQAFVLISIVLINALFGSLQEHRSNNAIVELQKMSTSQSKVLRNGKMILIPSTELVIGDIVLVEAGDTISADLTIYQSSNLKCIESVLTGESIEVLKNEDAEIKENAPIGEQIHKLFSGTNVINGRGFSIVTEIGNKTEIGKIAELLSSRESRMTPLQLKLHKLGVKLGIMGIIITLATFLFSLFVIEGVTENGMSAFQPSLLLGVSLAAAAIPEGLNAIVNIILAIGIKRMSEKNGLIKKFQAVETFGSTAVICSDKTGTLTMNKMTIVKMWTLGSDTENIPDELSEDQNLLLKMASLCTDCTVSEDPTRPKVLIGDPTEIAIVDLVLKNGFSQDKWIAENKRIGDIPFDSNRKLMTVINKIGDKNIVIVKGAPDVLIAKCKNVDGELANLINNNWSDNAIRVLAIAIKDFDGKSIDNLDPKNIEKDLTFLGLIGMIDPPREEVKLSIQECISAGIKPVMITGDHLNTAIAIAKDLGIIKYDNQLAITGTELDSLSDDYLNANIENYSVFARVSPENKIRIVKAWQSRDQVVAMTGDGVNDAPALQAADIGCAMGITGTDVSKSAADMILTDDNFATIVESVKSGRSIYDNIRRIVKFLLSTNVTGIISIVVGMFVFYLAFEIMGWGRITSADFQTFSGEKPDQLTLDYMNKNIRFQTTLTTIQILLNHIVIESLPGVALGTQRTTSSLMNKRPRSKFESLLADRLLFQILFSGIISGVVTIISYGIGSYIAIIMQAPGLRFYYGSIAAFVTITIGGVLKSISMSSSISIFKTQWKENKWVYIASFFSFMIIIISITVPQLSAIFAERPDFGANTTELLNSQLQHIFNNNTNGNLAHWSIYLIGICGAIIPFIILEFEKMIENKFFKKNDNEIITTFKLIEKPIHKHHKKEAEKLIPHSIINKYSNITFYHSDTLLNNFLDGS